MWDYRVFSRMDFRIFPILFCLMGISLLVISSMTQGGLEWEEPNFWTPLVKSQLHRFFLGWGIFFLCAMFDYRKLREWAPFLYLLILLLLIGLFFAPTIQNVHRWYRLPGIHLQPSEQAKLVLVIVLAAFLEKKGPEVSSWATAIQVGVLVLSLFGLILKQPDLGTALLLFPIAWTMSYFGGVHRGCLRVSGMIGILGIFLILSFFLGMLSHEKMRPVFTQVLKEYQYERLNPDTYHQKASQTAIAIGGLWGLGWNKGIFASRKWLPEAHTDSVFAAFAEEFGWVGSGGLIFLFYLLVYFSFQVVLSARDLFGKLLATGLSIYIALHVLINIAMMCAMLPISGVPLLFVTYGGSSVLTAMAALGLLQSIYSRRFMF